MGVVLRIPDDIAASLAEGGADLEREAPEAVAVEALGTGRLATTSCQRCSASGTAASWTAS